MLRRLSKGILLSVLFMYFMVGASYADRSKKQITICVLPCSDAVMTFKKFYPLVTYLKQQTGFDIQLVVPRDHAEFEWAIKNGGIDFALQDPHTYVRLSRLYNKGALMSSLNRDGTTSQYGVVIARRGSGINKVKDLKGKTVMFGPKLSATKWLVAKLLFEQNGINIDKDLRSYSNGGCCEDISFNVYLKEVDAGVVCDHFLEGHSEKQKELGMDAQQIIIIGRTKLVPTRVLAAHQQVSDDIAIKVNQALLRLDKNNPEHKKILYPAELGGFQKSEDKEYDIVRIIIAKMRE